jgi:hypothetical protein
MQRRFWIGYAAAIATRDTGMEETYLSTPAGSVMAFSCTDSCYDHVSLAVAITGQPGRYLGWPSPGI